jgi:hypothetical protein
MKKIIIKTTAKKKGTSKFFSRLSIKHFSQYGFWKKIALEQQTLIHAKNNT